MFMKDENSTLEKRQQLSFLIPELRELAMQIRNEIRATVYTVGGHLIAAKEISQHGQWLEFLEVVNIHPRNAQRMMSYARTLDQAGGPPANGKSLPAMNEVDRYVLDHLKEKVEALQAKREAIIEGHPDPAAARELCGVLKELHTCRSATKQVQDEVADLQKNIGDNQRIINAQKTRLQELDGQVEMTEERLAIMQEKPSCA